MIGEHDRTGKIYVTLQFVYSTCVRVPNDVEFWNFTKERKKERKKERRNTIENTWKPPTLKSTDEQTLVRGALIDQGLVCSICLYLSDAIAYYVFLQRSRSRLSYSSTLPEEPWG